MWCIGILGVLANVSFPLPIAREFSRIFHEWTTITTHTIDKKRFYIFSVFFFCFFKHLQTCSNMFEHLQTRSNIIEFIEGISRTDKSCNWNGISTVYTLCYVVYVYCGCPFLSPSPFFENFHEFSRTSSNRICASTKRVFIFFFFFSSFFKHLQTWSNIVEFIEDKSWNWNDTDESSGISIRWIRSPWQCRKGRQDSRGTRVPLSTSTSSLSLSLFPFLCLSAFDHDHCRVAIVPDTQPRINKPIKIRRVGRGEERRVLLGRHEEFQLTAEIYHTFLGSQITQK